jgi:hypothetical protein
MELEIQPEVLVFPDCYAGDKTVLEVVLNNRSDKDLQVQWALPVQVIDGELYQNEVFQVSGISEGDVIPGHGGSLTCHVIFAPDTSGYFSGLLGLSVGSEIYLVELEGSVLADFNFIEKNTFTADSDYRLTAGASSNQPGRLYVLLSHDPLSQGQVFALTPDGQLHPFDFMSDNGWQGFWYQKGTFPGNVLDLSAIDLRGLGCTLCQGPPEQTGGDDVHFGTAVITPPSNKPYNNASDFKYLAGGLYIATYVKSPFSSAGKPFDFNQGLLDFEKLNINSLAGTWQVTSEYYGAGRVHPNYLVVNENNGNISASWPPYPVRISYAANQPAYVIEFDMGAYHYVYTIDSLEVNRFSGRYTVKYNNQIVADNQEVCGVRVGSGLICQLKVDEKKQEEENQEEETKEEIIAKYSGTGRRNTRLFLTKGSWELQWESDDVLFISIYTKDGEFVDYVSGQEGTSYQPKVGEFYLEIKASYDQSWEVQVVSLDEP